MADSRLSLMDRLVSWVLPYALIAVADAVCPSRHEVDSRRHNGWFNAAQISKDGQAFNPETCIGGGGPGGV